MAPHGLRIQLKAVERIMGVESSTNVRPKVPVPDPDRPLPSVSRTLFRPPLTLPSLDLLHVTGEHTSDLKVFP
jgi:hypothetical protein